MTCFSVGVNNIINTKLPLPDVFLFKIIIGRRGLGKGRCYMNEGSADEVFDPEIDFRQHIVLKIID